MDTTPVRIPDSMIRRAESLIPCVEAMPEAEVWGARIAPAVVIRLALQKGLTELERECGRQQRRRKQTRSSDGGT